MWTFRTAQPQTPSRKSRNFTQNLQHFQGFHVLPAKIWQETVVTAMLRPSKFQTNSTDAEKAPESPFKLKPSQLGGSVCLDGNSASSDGGGANSEPPVSNPFLALNTDADEASAESRIDAPKVDENSDPLTKLTRNSATLPKSNLFAVKGTISEASGFVFGQNISERVTGTTETADKEDEPAAPNDANLFPRLNSSSGSDTTLEKKEVDGQSLLEATRIYEEKCKVQKRKYEEVETKTGEEDERNICEINCKLFAFVSSNYEERGRGMLRLNDSKTNSNESRVVFRTSGNFRVLINTKVWPEMVVESPSPKSLRMTVIDAEGHIKVFLVMARPDDVSKLFKVLKERVARQQQQQQDDEECPKAPVEIRVQDMSEEDNVVENNKNTTAADDDGGSNDSGEPQPKKAILEQ